MIERNVPVYSGNSFEVCRQYLAWEFAEHWEAGHIVERKMPMPTMKKPDRYKMVYYWIGITDQTCKMHDLSAEMKPCVTEKAAQGLQPFMACADAWRGHVTPAFRGLRSLQVVTRLLVNPMPAPA